MSKTIKFNAGKVQYDEETKKCTPLPHKGQVVIKPLEEEGCFDFRWSPKGNLGNVEVDERLIIPGDMTFKQVKLCNTGRVIALTFVSSGDRSLYWLQDVGDVEEYGQWTEKDQELLKSLQALVEEGASGGDGEAGV